MVKLVHIFDLYDTDNKIYLENKEKKKFFRAGYFELKKDSNLLSSNMKYWRDFFIKGEVPDEAPDYIKKAENIVFINSFSREERIMIDKLEKMEQDALAREAYVREESIEQGEKIGIKLGIEKGIEKGKKDIALSMLKDNIPIEKIKLYTGLSEEEINELLKK